MIRSVSPRVACAALCLVAAMALGCAGLGATSGREAAGDEGPMTQARMELIFAEQVDAIEGPSGMIRTVVDGVEIFLISDPANDQMQIISRIGMSDRLPRRYLNRLLEANAQATGEARYAIAEGIVYGVFLHPISTLTRARIESGFAQVLALAQNFGTTFSNEPQAPAGESGPAR